MCLPAQSQMGIDGAILHYERALVELHAGARGPEAGTPHQRKGRGARVSDAVGSSQVEEWKDDEPLF